MLMIRKFDKLKHSSEHAKDAAKPEFAELRQQCFSDYGLFVRTFFQGHIWGDFSPVQQDFITLEKTPIRRGCLEAVAAPRGNTKTVMKVLVKVIHSIVYGYHPFTVVIGYSAKEAEGKVKDIRDELLFNEYLNEVYGRQLNPTAGVQGFVTKNGCMVLPRGRGGQVRGLRHGKYRPTHIILDDVEDLEACQSPVQRQKTKDWLTKDVMPARQSGQPETMELAEVMKILQAPSGIIKPDVWDTKTFKGSITLVGTVLHEDSLLANLLKDPTWTRKKYRAVIKWSEREDLWEQWRDIYNNLDDEHSSKTARAFYEENETEMLKGTEVLWPAGEPYYDLMVQRLMMGEAAFGSEKQNDPFDPDRQILNPDKCNRFKVYTPADPEWPEALEDDGFAIVRHHDNKAIHSRDLRIIAFLDPALGKKPTNGRTSDPDFAALVVLAQDPAGFIYVLDTWMKKQPPSVYISQAFAKHEKWGFESLFLETNNFQSLLKNNFADEQKLWTQELRVIGVDQYSKKEARISTLQPYFENKWILFNENTDPEFLSQIRLFPTVHDDGPDALQGGVARLKRPVGGILTSSRHNGAI